MTDFETLWQFVMKRTERGVMTVQERSELEHIFNLMKGCDCQSYLEIGTAEGNSLYVLGHAVAEWGSIESIDLGEDHTKLHAKEIFNLLSKRNHICFVTSDSTNPTAINREIREFDCILIDGGHDFATVLSDSILYAPLATKYIFWHDIQLPEVKAAVEWFVKRWKLGKYSTFINSDSFGYAIVEVGK